MKFLTRFCGKIVHNGKGLGEGGDKIDGNSNQTRTEQKPFSFFQNYKKIKKRNDFLRRKVLKSSK
ncbi:hypothetical protein BHF72_2385 [Cloacibacterium normanense]|uniref:Uncharacterized protein n=1 Tax=Cloacibacterium normanense TaxID=237258 RepID=A0A1E5UE42_9FLAO|nr:hypothetical protein BHF72_2385 [Cloacibacterium normanense]